MKPVDLCVYAVGEQRDVAVRQRLAVVLHTEGVVAVMPFHLLGLPVDQTDHVETAEANVDVAVRQR